MTCDRFVIVGCMPAHHPRRLASITSDGDFSDLGERREIRRCSACLCPSPGIYSNTVGFAPFCHNSQVAKCDRGVFCSAASRYACHFRLPLPMMLKGNSACCRFAINESWQRLSYRGWNTNPRRPPERSNACVPIRLPNSNYGRAICGPYVMWGANEVVILIVGRKVGNKLIVEGVEYHGHQDDPVEQPGSGPEENAE